MMQSGGALPQRIGIVGIGLLGSSMAVRFRSSGIEVWGYDLNSTALEYALQAGIIDGRAEDLVDLCIHSESLVIAAPVRGILETLRELSGPLRPMAQRLRWIIDIASVKGPIMEVGHGLPNFLGTHPMAGTERQGPEGADPRLFERRPWVVLPCPAEQLREDVHSVIECMGAFPLELTATEHDAIVAATSHLPQTLATVLAAVLLPETYHGLHGSGLRSMTRLAASPWSMWRSIYETNSDAILHELRSFHERFATVITALEQQNFDVLEWCFDQAAGHLKELGDAGTHSHDAEEPLAP